MEDWLHFVETFALYIFWGSVLPPALKQLWAKLTRAVRHYFRPRPADETREEFLAAAAGAARDLREYAEELENLLRLHGQCAALKRLFTMNLHGAVCR